MHVQFTTQLQHGDRMEFGTSDWHNEAFGYSPVAGHRRRRVLDAEARERAIQEEAKRVAAMKRKAALEEQAAALLEAGGDEVTELFSRDWKQLHWSLDLLPQGGREVEKLKLHDLLLKYYQPLRDLFRYYSNLLGGEEKGPHNYNMSANEFSCLIIDAGIQLSSIMPQQLFVYAITGKRKGRRKPGMGLSRAAFIEAMLLCAAELAFSTAQDAGATGMDLVLRAEMVERLLDMFLMPVADKTTSSSTVRALLKSADVMPNIVRGTPAMKALFSTFADVDEDASDEEGAAPAAAGAGGAHDVDSLSMTQDAFFTMLEAIGIMEQQEEAEPEQPANKALARKQAAPAVGQGADSDVLTRAEASLAFMLAQSEDEGGAVGDLAVEGLDELDFNECVEAFAHVALGKWEDPEVGLGDKMSWLMDMMEEWLDKHGVQYNKDEALMEI